MTKQRRSTSRRERQAAAEELAIAALGVVISIYYYFGWIKAAFFETWTPSDDLASARPARTPVGLVAGLALGALALSSIVLGFYQGPFGQWLTLAMR